MDGIHAFPHPFDQKIGFISCPKYIVVVTTVIVNELVRVPAKPVCFWVFDQSLVNPVRMLIGHRDEIFELQLVPARVGLLHSGQIVKPEIRKLLPPIESVFGNIEIKRISNTGQDGLAVLTLGYVVAKGMLIADFVIAISPKGDSYSIPGLQPMQLATKCAWTEQFPQSFFSESSARLG
jgi:hypothetical protein